jgi:hypothetical protein
LFLIVILGTWSREQVEILKDAGKLVLADDEILNFVEMDWLFAVHRYAPALVAFWGYRMWRKSGLNFRSSHGFWLFAASLLQISFGAIHIVYIVPTWTQIAHVVLGSGLLTYVFAVSLSYKEINK